MHPWGLGQVSWPSPSGEWVRATAHPYSQILKFSYQGEYSTSRPLRLAASGRHLGETTPIIKQPKFKAGHSKPLRRTSASSRQTGHSSKEATDFEEAPLTDQEARQRGRIQGPAAWPAS